MVIPMLSLFFALSMFANPTVKVSGQELSVESDGDELRVRSFHAYKRDGQVRGNAVVAVPGAGHELQLNITCIRVVDGDTLVIGGSFEQATEFLPEGTQAVFAVKDGGTGDRARDFLSALHGGSCECDQPFGTLLAIERGDIDIDKA